MIKVKKLLSVLVLGILFITFTAFTPIVKADSQELEFDKTNLLEDLQSDENFSIYNYPFYETDKPTMKVEKVLEYCYSYKSNLMQNYGLYIYLYNPNGIKIDEDSKQNKIQIATLYDVYPVNRESKAIDYEKFSLQFCSKTTTPNTYRLFYKFRVVDHKCKDGKSLVEKLNSTERRYDISGIELTTEGKSLPIEYTVSTTYYFSGFAKGYGPDSTAESTLIGDTRKMETISLDVKHTFYRSKTSSKGANYQNQLDTVYFSVPKKYLEEYGKLQRIKAEWYEYKTKDILVTSNEGLYNAVYANIGRNIGYKQYDDIGYYLAGNHDDSGGFKIATWGWNLGDTYLHTACETLYYVFKTNNISAYDPYADLTTVGGVQSNDLYDYIINYNKTFESGKLAVKEGQISADLFVSDIDGYRKIDNEQGKIQFGYSYYDFDADADIQILNSWQTTNPNFFDNWFSFGLGSAFKGGPDEESKTLAPIQILNKNDLSGTSKDISDKLAVNYNDVEKIKEMYNEATTISGKDDEERVVVLFRFAQSDYYTMPIDMVHYHTMLKDTYTKGQAYIARESVFLNFDIIQLTFRKDGVMTIIPVVANPIDIVNAITPPPFFDNGLEWWQILLAIIIIIIIFFLVIKFFPIILGLIITIVKIVVSWLIGLLKAIFKPRKKKRKATDKEE